MRLIPLPHENELFDKVELYLILNPNGKKEYTAREDAPEEIKVAVAELNLLNRERNQMLRKCGDIY